VNDGARAIDFFMPAEAEVVTELWQYWQ